MLRPSDTRSNSFFPGLKAFGIPLLLVIVSASRAQETPDGKHQETAPQSSTTQTQPRPEEAAPPIASAYLEWSGLLVLKTTRMLLLSRRETSSGYSPKM